MQPVAIALPYDADVLADDFDGDLALIRRLVLVFLGDCPERLDILRRALGASDIERLFSIAHSIKGAVSHFGATRTTAAAHGVEACCRHGDLATMPMRVNELATAMNELATSLQRDFVLA